ncbi:MAG: hypothetical protein B7Y26_08595 [Hydrogenophilales bacterium 16-64-46]|nr:MAG: hypothetical protein B7Y26_08595 [Hydrogenophilales bacterium 16-64-46]OZA37140.1 MAG: hypothetical protein B7X87_12640 [Hydrogenophilales bacterium 17-64-34]HQS99377.1 hypothetical protein [Thiobacillus sp.]
MPARRLLAAWLVALTLFLGQSAAFAHALAHLGEHDADHAPGTVCELCVGQASLGAGLPAAALPDLPLATLPAPQAVRLPYSPQTGGPTPSARAPPAHSV